MLFRQLFERESSTYSYLIARRKGGEALLIDPIKEELDKYLQLIRELDLKLVFAIDTHVHADHVTALGGLREATTCTTIMGEQSKPECVSRRVRDGEILRVDGLELRALYTPGHTDDSYSFVMDDRGWGSPCGATSRTKPFYAAGTPSAFRAEITRATPMSTISTPLPRGRSERPRGSCAR